MDLTTSCGLFKWRPKFLQRLASRKMYVLVYSLLGVIQGMGYSYLSASLSTIEKQFGMKSTETAWVFSGNEISQICFIVLLPFLSRIKKRTLWTSVAMVFSGFGIFMCAIPFLVKDKAEYSSGWDLQGSAPSTLCIPGVSSKQHCSAKKVRDWSGLLTIFFGFFISGFGTSFYFSFGIPFVDDNVPKKNSPLILGVISAARTIGPALGSILGTFCLSFYVIPGLDVGLKEGDPGWLGAWWMGFIIISGLTILIAPFLALFPERLETDEETDAVRLEKLNKEQEDKPMKEYLTETKLRIIRLARNKVWVYSSLSTVALLAGFIGFITFIPKVFEFGFRQKASSTGSFSGIANALGTSIGLILSGYLIGRYKFKARTLQAWNVFVGIIAIVAIFAIFQINCPTELVVYEGSCSNDCLCSESKFDPVCSEDGVTMFYSPCGAGCRSSSSIKSRGKKSKKIKMYTECSCVEQAARDMNASRVEKWWDSIEDDVPSPISGLNAESGGDDRLEELNQEESIMSSAIEGFCPADCNKSFYIVISCMLVFSLLSSTSRVGSTLISLRTVEPEDKSASLLIMVSVLSLFAFLPSPIIVGKLLDNSCIVWGENCGERTTCLLYDNHRMRTTISSFVGVFVIISTIFDIIAWFYCKDLQIFDEEPGNQTAGDSSELKPKIETKSES